MNANEKKTLISIAMTTYNGEKFLCEQIDSILSQTHKNFELIICDDCSTDKTKEIIQRYQKKDSRIKVFFNEQNLGFIKNFEQAIKLCTADYIALCDQDDIWTNDHLQILYDNIGDNDCIGANAELIDENGRSLGMTMKNYLPIPKLPKSNEEIFSHELYGNIIQGASCLISKNLLNKALPIPEPVQYHDWWFAQIASANRGCFYINKIILKYRRHTNNQTSTKIFTPIKAFFTKTTDCIEWVDDSKKHIEILDLIKSRTFSKKNIKKVESVQNFYKKVLYKEKKINTTIYFLKNYNSMYLDSKRNFFRFIYHLLFFVIKNLKLKF